MGDFPSRYGIQVWLYGITLKQMEIVTASLLLLHVAVSLVFQAVSKSCTV